MEPIEQRTDALRPFPWLAGRHPDFAERASSPSDATTAVLAALAHDPRAAQSMTALARCAGVSRKQAHEVCERLRRFGRLEATPDGRRREAVGAGG
jgi:predicted transcriptional regulator